MARFFYRKKAHGTGDGSSIANAAAFSLAALATAVNAAAPDDEFFLYNERMSPTTIFQATQQVISAQGSLDAPISIIAGNDTVSSKGSAPGGLSRSRYDRQWRFVGSRANPWTNGRPKGGGLYQLTGNSSYLAFEGGFYEGFNEFDGVFELREGTHNGLTFRNGSVANVGRVFEYQSGANTPGMIVEDWVAKDLSRGFARTRGVVTGIEFKRIFANANFADGDSIIQVIQFQGSCDGALIQDCMAMHGVAFNVGTSTYIQGDGYNCEDGNDNLLFQRVGAYGFSDGGWDCKGNGHRWEDCWSAYNKRNWRLWGVGLVMERCSGYSSQPRRMHNHPVHMLHLPRSSTNLTCNGCDFEQMADGGHFVEMEATAVLNLNHCRLTVGPNLAGFAEENQGIINFNETYINNTLINGTYNLGAGDVLPAY